MLSRISFYWYLGLTFKAIMVPISFSLDTFSIEQDATALADALEVKAFEDGAVGLESSAVAGGVSILEDSLVHPIV